MTLRRNPFKGKFIVFYKGGLVTDHILDYIIFAAIRGLMTPAAEKLLLISDARRGRASSSGLRTIGRIIGKNKKGRIQIDRTRRSDCITLKQLITRYRKTERVTDKSKITKLTSFKINKLKVEKSTETPTLTPSTTSVISADSRNVCMTCERPFSGKRTDAKFCSSKCRQKSYRRGAA